MAGVSNAAVPPSSTSALRKTPSVRRKCTLSKAGLQSLAKPVSSTTKASHPDAGAWKAVLPQSSNGALIKTSIKTKPSLLKLVLCHGVAANRTRSKSSLFPSAANAKNDARSHEASALMKRNDTAASSGSANPIVIQPATVAAKPAFVIDLTDESSKPESRKRKRSLVAKEAKVDLNAVESKYRASAKRRRASTVVKLEGKGTSKEPYIL